MEMEEEEKDKKDEEEYVKKNHVQNANMTTI